MANCGDFLGLILLFGFMVWEVFVAQAVRRRVRVRMMYFWVVFLRIFDVVMCMILLFRGLLLFNGYTRVYYKA